MQGMKRIYFANSHYEEGTSTHSPIGRVQNATRILRIPFSLLLLLLPPLLPQRAEGRSTFDIIPHYIDYTIDSPIKRSSNEFGGGRRRSGHIATIVPITIEKQEEDPAADEKKNGTRTPTSRTREANFRVVYYYASAFMAMEHFNSRSGVVIPELPKVLQGCDFHMTMDIRDSQSSKQKAVHEMTEALAAAGGDGGSSGGGIPPFAVLGSYTSGVSQPLSILADALQVVQISGSATSTALDKSHYFTRTIPTNQGESAAVMTYLSSIGIGRVGILYVQDAYGQGFQSALLQEAHNKNISVAISMPYVDFDPSSVESAMQLLKVSEVHYILFVENGVYWKPVVQAAYDHGIMGPDSGRQWYVFEDHETLLDDFELDTFTESDVAEAINGMGIIQLFYTKQKSFEREFEDFLLENNDSASTLGSTTMLDRFISSHVDSALLDKDKFPLPETEVYHYMAYDAIVALGIAACRTPGLFTSEDLLTQLLGLEFPGVTGWVSLGNVTGNRMVKDLQFNVVNVLFSGEKSTSTSLRFQTTTTATIQGPNVTNLQDAFVYADGTIYPPPDAPVLASHDYHLIPIWALGIGWMLGGLALVMSILCGGWVILFRQYRVVTISQPIFLCQLCAGTLLMSLAIVPLGMQEQLMDDGSISSKWNLDVACMASPWLFNIGFAIAIAAIVAKAMRLNKLMNNSRGMRRIAVQPTDVLQPLGILMTINVVFLTACTFAAPYTWHRIPVENNVDRFGRAMESHGTCLLTANTDSDTDVTTYYFMIPILIVNFGGICFAAYQCYLARNFPTEMSESWYLFAATITLIEVFVVLGPLLFLPGASPTTYFLVAAAIISLSCFSILLPIFVPKYRLHHRRIRESQKRGRHPVAMATVLRGSTTNGPALGRSSLRRSSLSGSTRSMPGAAILVEANQDRAQDSKEIHIMRGQMAIIRHLQ